MYCSVLFSILLENDSATIALSKNSNLMSHFLNSILSDVKFGVISCGIYMIFHHSAPSYSLRYIKFEFFDKAIVAESFSNNIENKTEQYTEY